MQIARPNRTCTVWRPTLRVSKCDKRRTFQATTNLRWNTNSASFRQLKWKPARRRSDHRYSARCCLMRHLHTSLEGKSWWGGGFQCHSQNALWTESCKFSHFLLLKRNCDKTRVQGLVKLVLNLLDVRILKMIFCTISWSREKRNATSHGTKHYTNYLVLIIMFFCTGKSNLSICGVIHCRFRRTVLII